MPRKTDGIEFEIHPRPTKGEDGKPLLYVRPAMGLKKSFKELDTYATKYLGLRPGEKQMVFDVVMDVVGRWLSDGYRVEIETPGRAHRPQDHSRQRHQVCRTGVHPLQGVCQGGRIEP